MPHQAPVTSTGHSHTAVSILIARRITHRDTDRAGGYRGISRDRSKCPSFHPHQQWYYECLTPKSGRLLSLPQPFQQWSHRQLFRQC